MAITILEDQKTIKNLTLLRDFFVNKPPKELVYKTYGGVDEQYKDIIEEEIKKPCNTSCCALGYAPYINTGDFIPVKDDFFNSFIEEYQSIDMDFAEDYEEDFIFSYERYSYRIFPELDIKANLFKFLFSHRWDDYDQTIQGFIDRLNFLLDEKLTPDWKFTSFVKGWDK